jgi:20S proteasome alpha/beta subunit
MTVGIAAMCYLNRTPMIVGASDRMITAGDTEFEPESAKIYHLTNSIAMLIAGETAAQTDIRYRAMLQIGLRLAADASWMRVEEAAHIVSRATVGYHRDFAQRTVLEPMGLTFDTFIARQSQFQPSVLSEMMRRISDARPSIQTVVTGVDESGAHTYTIYADGQWVCGDTAGFACIGSGARHAESQFMFAKHSGYRQFPESQLLTYTAKRRAEVAPGVGTDTDMFVVVGLGGYSSLALDEVERLRVLYEEMKNAQDAARLQADEAAKVYFTKVLERIAQHAPPPSEQTPLEPSSGLTPENPHDSGQPNAT